MRQSVARLGATIDTATPAEVEAIISNALTAEQVTKYIIKKGIVKLSATGTGTTVGSEMNLDLKVSSQYDWLLDRIAIGGPGAVSALVGVYENDATSDTNLLETISLPASGKYSDSFSNRCYVTANTQIVIVVSNGVNGQDVAFRLQIRQQNRAGQAG